MNKVVCINSGQHIHLTVGKNYEVICKDDTHYQVTNDNGVTYYYRKEYFIDADLTQVVGGDQIDNWKPSFLSGKRWGDVATYKVLAGCKNDKEALQAIVDTYKSWYPNPVQYVSWDGKPMVKNWLEIADENWQMGYMKRWAGDDTMFSKVIDKLGVVV